jgi:hypothetical protein
MSNTPELNNKKEWLSKLRQLNFNNINKKFIVEDYSSLLFKSWLWYFLITLFLFVSNVIVVFVYNSEQI